MDIKRALQLLADLAKDKHDDMLFQMARNLFYRRQS